MITGWPITTPSDIYAIRCKETGRVYIGRTGRLEQRIREHFRELRNGQKQRYAAHSRHPSVFQEDYNKYGEKSFEVYVLEEDVPPEKCKEREAYWIEEYKAADPMFGYNKLDEKAKDDFPKPKQELPPKIIRLNKE